MKIQNIKKTKYEQIAEILDRQGYITDSETLKIYGTESDLYKVSEHVRIWKKLQADKQFFAGKKIVEKRKGHRCHLVRVEGEDSYYKVGKQFFNSLNEKVKVKVSSSKLYRYKGDKGWVLMPLRKKHK